MVSKACYIAAYRRKLEELAALPDVDLTLVVPPYWRQGRSKAGLEAGYDHGYKMRVENPRFNGSFHFHYYPNLPEIIDAERPDILHMDEEPYDLVTFRGLRAARARGVPALFFTWQNIERAYPPPFRWFEAYAYANTHGAIAGNQDGAAILRHKGYPRPLYVIPQFGIDPEFFAPSTTPLPEQLDAQHPFVIGFAGRLVEEKGLRTLLHAAAGLKGPWVMRLLGDGPFKHELAAEAAGLGMGDRIQFLGAVPSSAVPEHLRGFHVLANPSLTKRGGKTQWKEQFGRSLVEAMACGIPVVGSDSGEIPHVVGDTGLLAPEGDAAALRAHLEQLMSSSDLRRSLAARGRARALALFTHQRIAQQTHQCYRQLLDR